MARARRELGVEFEVAWHPYFLDPNAKERPGLDAKREVYRRKGMDPRQVEQGMSSLFLAEGMEFSLDGPTGNTMDSHRLAAWAFTKYGADTQDRLVEIMFRKYFSESRSPSDVTELMAAAAEVGADVDAARALLEGDAGKQQIAHQHNELLQSKLVTGVPHYFVSLDGTTAVPQGISAHFPGAQDTDTFFNIARSVVERARGQEQTLDVFSEAGSSKL